MRWNEQAVSTIRTRAALALLVAGTACQLAIDTDFRFTDDDAGTGIGNLDMSQPSKTDADARSSLVPVADGAAGDSKPPLLDDPDAGERKCGSCDIGSSCTGDMDCRSGVCLAGACAICRPNDTQCVGTTPRTCAPEGTWVNAAPCTGDFAVCVPDRARCTCEEGASRCVGTEVERSCSAGQIIEASCAVGSACQDGRCRTQAWTRQIGSGEFDDAPALWVAGDSLIVAGTIGGALFGQVNEGASDAFVIKYDAGGNELWARQFGSVGSDGVDVVTADAGGNVIVAGDVYGTLPGQVGSGFIDVFVRRYDPEGIELWTRQIAGTSHMAVYAAVADASGNVIVAGRTQGELPAQVASGSGLDAWVRKYDPNGTELWTVQFGTGPGFSTQVNALSVDPRGNVIVVGDTGGELPGQTNQGSSDAFVRKYDPNGREIWTRQFGPSPFDSAMSVAVGPARDVFVAGYGSGALPGETIIESLFISHYDENGERLSNAQLDTGGGTMSIAASGDLMLAGSFSENLPGQVSAGGRDALVSLYGTDGTLRWRRSFGSLGDDTALAAAVDSSGNLFVSGRTEGALPGQTNAGGSDAFVSKLLP